MGTNYYVRLKDKEIHIGKSSCGWMFLFAPNPEHYDNTKAGINRFLKLHKNEFYDEYDRLVDIREFWNMVESKKEGFTLLSYYIEESKIRIIPSYEWEGAKKEIITKEGLRISDTAEFS